VSHARRAPSEMHGQGGTFLCVRTLRTVTYGAQNLRGVSPKLSAGAPLPPWGPYPLRDNRFSSPHALRLIRVSGGCFATVALVVRKCPRLVAYGLSLAGAHVTWVRNRTTAHARLWDHVKKRIVGSLQERMVPLQISPKTGVRLSPRSEGSDCSSQEVQPNCGVNLQGRTG
jgi:hypothetical protein